MSQEMPTTDELTLSMENAIGQFVDPNCVEVSIENSPLFLAKENAPVAKCTGSQVLEAVQTPHGVLYLVNPEEGYVSEMNK